MSPWFDVKPGLNFHPVALVSITAISSMAVCVCECVCWCLGGCVVECVSVISVCLFVIVGVG